MKSLKAFAGALKHLLLASANESHWGGQSIRSVTLREENRMNHGVASWRRAAQQVWRSSDGYSWPRNFFQRIDEQYLAKDRIKCVYWWRRRAVERVKRLKKKENVLKSLNVNS